MHCPRCGAALGGSSLRCGACRRFTPALWLGLCHGLLLAASLAGYAFYRRLYLPRITDLNTGLGDMLPVPLRLHVALSELALTYGLAPLALVLVLLAVAARRGRLPVCVRSGAALAVTTCLVALWVLAGLLLGFVGILAPIVRIE